MNSTSDKDILKNVVSLEKKLSTVLLQNFQTFKFIKKNKYKKYFYQTEPQVTLLREGDPMT